MGAPKFTAMGIHGPHLHPTGTHGLVARHYEPLADSHAGTHGPAKPVLCSRFREHRQAPEEAWLCTLLCVVERHEVSARTTAPLYFYRGDLIYLISTFAPASSIFFLMASASALLMPSLIGFGAPSTRTLASFRPRLVTSRTALMVFTLFSPAAVRITVNSVFSSAAAAPAPPPAAGAATATAAAAETPNLSSMSLMSCESSRTVMLPIASRMSCLAIAMVCGLLDE